MISKKVNYMFEKQIKKIVFIFVTGSICIVQIQAGQTKPLTKSLWEHEKSIEIQCPQPTRQKNPCLKNGIYSIHRKDYDFDPLIQVTREGACIEDDIELFRNESSVDNKKPIWYRSKFKTTISWQAFEKAYNSKTQTLLFKVKMFCSGRAPSVSIEENNTFFTHEIKDVWEGREFIDQDYLAQRPKRPTPNRVESYGYELSINPDKRTVIMSKLQPAGTRAAQRRKVALITAGVIGAGAGVAYLLRGSLKSGQATA